MNKQEAGKDVWQHCFDLSMDVSLFPYEATDPRKSNIGKAICVGIDEEMEKERQKKLTYQRFRLSCEFTHNILDKHISFSPHHMKSWASRI
jgi:hypothetical protein